MWWWWAGLGWARTVPSRSFHVEVWVVGGGVYTGQVFIISLLCYAVTQDQEERRANTDQTSHQASLAPGGPAS